ncbi:hypothetical protein [Streptomyces sp. NPDC057636]|uniref:hypothetical protein n=1 Tax=Streptomyces sp. NPDC057636 TaxID=3346189 RepID=UPI003675B257
MGPLIDRTGAHPSVDWNAVGLMLLTQPWVLQCSSSELAVLEFAASLVGKVGVNLHKALAVVDAREDEYVVFGPRVPCSVSAFAFQSKTQPRADAFESLAYEASSAVRVR